MKARRAVKWQHGVGVWLGLTAAVLVPGLSMQSSHASPPPRVWPDPAQGRIEPPRDWDSVGRHVLFLLQESDDDFAALRAEQVSDTMWMSKHYIGSPLRGDDPVPPSVIMLQGYTAWFHGTPLAHGTRRQMTHEMLTYADDIERTTAGAMEREDIEDMYVRFTACALNSDKYVMLSNQPYMEEESDDVDAKADAEWNEAAGEYEVTLMVGRQPGLC